MKRTRSRRSTSEPQLIDEIRSRIEGTAGEHAWTARALVLAWMVWIWLAFFGPEPPSYLRNPFGAATLIVHEAGHAAFMWFGNELLTVAGGTIFQLAIPALVAGLFWRRRDVFGSAVALFWLGTSLVDAGIYAADARAQLLPLVSPWGDGDDGTGHDWTYMLMRFGKLSRDQIIGGRIEAAGTLLMPLALAAGAWVVWVLARAPKGAPPTKLVEEEARLAAALARSAANSGSDGPRGAATGSAQGRE